MPDAPNCRFQSCVCPFAAARDSSALLHPLIDPAKLATLGDRGANPRIQKVVAILRAAEQDGQDPAAVAHKAVIFIGWGGTEKGKLTAAAMARDA